jgi:hypothetical protein
MDLTRVIRNYPTDESIFKKQDRLTFFSQSPLVGKDFL